jgi:hypothetical protein
VTSSCISSLVAEGTGEIFGKDPSLSPDGILKTPRGSAGTKSPIKIPGTPLGSRGRSPPKEVRLSPTSPALDRFSPAPDHPSPDVWLNKL